VTTDDATTAPVTTTTTTEPSDLVVKHVDPVRSAPANAPVARTTVRTTAVHKAKKKRPPLRTLDLPLAIPYHAIVFDPQQWLNDNPGTPTGQAAVAIAMNYLGVPYRWGGTVPETGFDCSGLVRFVYAQLGISLVHYAAAQFAAFPKLSPAQLQPGDLVFFEPKLDGPGHVGLYIGHDEMIEAPHTGAVVRIASVSGAAAQLGFMGAVRPYGNQLLGALTLLSVESRPASLIAKVPY
jgi:cell wall-associated NlpC family hydrolase